MARRHSPRSRPVLLFVAGFLAVAHAVAQRPYYPGPRGVRESQRAMRGSLRLLNALVLQDAPAESVHPFPGAEKPRELARCRRKRASFRALELNERAKFVNGTSGSPLGTRTPDAVVNSGYSFRSESGL